MPLFYTSFSMLFVYEYVNAIARMCWLMTAAAKAATSNKLIVTDEIEN